MSAPSSFPSTFSEVYAQTITTRQLTHSDRQGMQRALLDSALSVDELRMINRLLYALRRGQIQISA